MASKLSVLVLGFLASASFAASSCSNPLQRREWRTLSDGQKKAYISAVKCLQAKPTKIKAYFSGTQSRYDDFVATHINETDYIHFVGHFHPWHRYFVASYEHELRNECGYEGAQPYWDWTQDATIDGFMKSPVFDPITGFGGNGPYINSTNDSSVTLHIPGKTGGGCVKDGPFRNYTVNLGPLNSTAYNPRCMTRDTSPSFASQKLNSAFVNSILDSDTFRQFDIKAQGKPVVEDMSYHGGGHLGVGGDLGVIGDLYASPSDPLFFLHHANLDRLWWMWESVDLETRAKDISGPDTQYAYPFDFYGYVPYSNITLDYMMHYGPLMPNTSWMRVGDVMDIESGVLCYEYV